MKCQQTIFLLFSSLLLSSRLCAQQVALQPWMQVSGTVPGQSLGAEVRGIAPSANLPYRASILSFGNTGLYTLQTRSDTVAQRVFIGSNMQTGDLNGDGRRDIVIRRSGGSSYVDTVLIFWGTQTGVDTLSPTKLYGLSPQDGFGSSICIGNLIGDSIADLVVGSPQYPPSPVIRGRVYIYRGGSPFDTIAAIVLNGDSARYTLGVACAIGDLNNDGYNDLIVRGVHQTTPRFSYVDIWFAGAQFDTLKDIRLRGPEINSKGLASFDANGDGVDDLLWTNRDTISGISDWIYVHYGGAVFDTLPSLRLRDPQAALFGNVIVNADDMNGDGYNDIAVGAYFSQSPGYVFIYGGGPQIDQYYDAAAGLGAQSYFGWSVSSVGDVNGNGLADIIVGAPNYEFGNQRGYWTILLGDSAIQVTSVKDRLEIPSTITLNQCYPNPFNPRTTIRYSLNRDAKVSLEVFNLLGQHISTLESGDNGVGNHESVFDATGLASGVYLYRLTAVTQDGVTYTETKKLTIIK